MFRERTGNKYRNIRAERDPAAPLRAEADWYPNEEEEAEQVKLAANRLRAQCKDKGVSEIDAEQAIAIFRAVLREMAEMRAEEDRLEAEANQARPSVDRFLARPAASRLVGSPPRFFRRKHRRWPGVAQR